MKHERESGVGPLRTVTLAHRRVLLWFVSRAAVCGSSEGATLGAAVQEGRGTQREPPPAPAMQRDPGPSEPGSAGLPPTFWRHRGVSTCLGLEVSGGAVGGALCPSCGVRRRRIRISGRRRGLLSPQVFGNWTFGTLVFTVMVFTVTLKVHPLT